uniref:Synaptogyrin 4 n=1 Tax=Saimiri boliviensis boliviensis TaxID=39432 RepID=A0A2K6SWZ0_SAIBB
VESPQLHCILNSNNVACSFAVGAGFLAFLTCLAFLVLDTQETHVAGTRFRTAFQLLDFVLAVLWVIVWFVGFCFLTNQWQHSPPKEFLLGSSSAQAAIAFTFFSILAWAGPQPSPSPELPSSSRPSARPFLPTDIPGLLGFPGPPKR